MKNRSIKRKLTLMMMGISLSAIALTVGSITAYLIYDMHNSKSQEIEVTAAIAGDRNSAALVFNDTDRVIKNLEIFRLSPSVLVACIYDAKGILFAPYKADDSKGMTCPASVDAITHVGKVLTSLQAITKDKEVVGHIYMVSDMRDIDVYIQKIILISITVVALVLLVTLLLTMYFQRAISAPILELAAAAKSITAGQDYTLEARTTYHNDETDILAGAFNTMLREVRQRDQALMLANETLEQKVSQRTQQLEEAKFKAESANEAKSEFLRNMSHEFRTPLHAMISFSAYGLKEFDSASRDQLKQYFHFIQKGADRLVGLVGQVLDLARLEQGEYEVHLKRTDVGSLVCRAAELMQPLAQEKKILLNIVDSAQPINAVCDEDKIVQVVTNMLANAIKFTPAGKRISVSALLQNDQAVVSVRDEGVGIPAGEEDAIFESFRQSSRTKTGAGGTGLGLAICRNIISLHGGVIRARGNSDGIGAEVTFSLPLSLKEGHRIIKLTPLKRSYEIAA